MCDIRGTVKKETGRVLVGDFVEIIKDDLSDKHIVTKVYDRQNCLLRPPLANLQQLFIVVAKAPQPDFFLVDKLIIYCFINDISPILVINKKDLFTEHEINNIKAQYNDVVDEILIVSAIEDNIEFLQNYLKNKLSAFAGQSAVGKSTLINKLIPNLNLQTNGLSLKIDRGKHTTRHSEIYVKDNIKIVDTPGFSMLELGDIEPDELNMFYPEFDEFKNKCVYNNCCHIKAAECDCGVYSAVIRGLINSDRYERYCVLYESLLEKWRKKYD